MGELLCWVEAHPGLAAWIQGIFSVVAILAAVFLAAYQSSVDRRLQRRQWAYEQRMKALNFFQVIRLCRSLVEKVDAELSDLQAIDKIRAKTLYFDTGELEKMAGLLAQCPVYELAPQFVPEAMIAHSQFRQFKWNVDKLLAMPVGTSANFDGFRKVSSEIVLAARKSEKSVEYLVDALPLELDFVKM